MINLFKNSKKKKFLNSIFYSSKKKTFMNRLKYGQDEKPEYNIVTLADALVNGDDKKAQEILNEIVKHKVKNI